MLPGFDAAPLRREFKRLVQRALSAFTTAENTALRTAIGAASTDIATDTAAGIVELSTAAEFATGIDPSRVASVSVLRNGLTIIETAQATTSGTFKDSGAIPAWATEIDINYDQVSTNGTSAYLVQIGDSGGVEPSGYTGGGSTLSTATILAYTGAFGIGSGSMTAAATHSGVITLRKQNSATNTWVCSGFLTRVGDGQTYFTAGSKSLSAPLTFVRITSATPDTFDAGSVSFSYR